MSIFSETFFDAPKKIDFKRISRSALASAPAILRRLLPDGKIVKNEYIARNPKRADHRVGSFKINVKNGLWSDFATGDSGGDLISLVAYLRNIKQGEAAKILASMLGIPAEVQR